MCNTNRSLVHSSDLLLDDLGSILGASCENYRLCLEYFVDVLEGDVNRLLDGLSIELNEINNPKNWMYASDVRKFKFNFIKNTNSIFSHREWYKIGKGIRFVKNSLLLLLVKIMSEEQILLQVGKFSGKYNNEFTITPIAQKRGDVLLIFKDFPYFKKYSLGSECWFAMGVFAANFDYHDIVDYEIRQLICGKIFSNMLTDYYSNYGLTFTCLKENYYFNDELIAEKIQLKNAFVYEELSSLNLDLRELENATVYEIKKDLYFNNTLLFKKNEVYGAPYCLMRLQWTPSWSLRRFFNLFVVSKYKTEIIAKMEEQLEFSNFKLFEADEAKRKLEALNLSLEAKVAERTRALEEAKNVIEQASEEKSAFFVNLAHEIKTPLTLIHNAMESYVSKHQADADMAVIQKNIDKLLRDMVNFLDVQKLERNQVFYDHSQGADVSELMDIKVPLFAELAKRKGIKLTGQWKEKIFAQIDPEAMDRILGNLLDNAIRYTKEGGEVRVMLTDEHEQVKLMVHDTGLGIPHQEQENIFKPYHQLSHQKKNIQGIGMGLAIVKRVVDSAQGKIRVSSAWGVGSCFEIMLPKCRAADVIAPWIRPARIEDLAFNLPLVEERYDAGKNTILAVEDNTEMLSYLQQNLRAMYNFYFALDGSAALEKLKFMPKPDLIMSDVMMDGMNGHEFLKILRKETQFADIPFIFITAKASDEDVVMGLEMGSVDYVKKPFGMNELLARIKTHVELKLARERLDVLSRIDPLTQLSNRRDILEKLAGEQARFEKNRRPFSLVLGDIDHFKKVNDQFGHDCGDAVIMSIAETISDSLRKSDCTARWGGEEFLIVLPDANGEDGRAVAEKIRLEIERSEFPFKDKLLQVTMTFGVVEAKETIKDIDQMIALADEALYDGKKQGKNCVVLR